MCCRLQTFALYDFPYVPHIILVMVCRNTALAATSSPAPSMKLHPGSLNLFFICTSDLNVMLSAEKLSSWSRKRGTHCPAFEDGPSTDTDCILSCWRHTLDSRRRKENSSVGLYHRSCATVCTVKNTAVLGSTVMVLSLLPQLIGLLAEPKNLGEHGDSPPKFKVGM